MTISIFDCFFMEYNCHIKQVNPRSEHKPFTNVLFAYHCIAYPEASRIKSKFVEKFYGYKTLRESNKKLVSCRCFDDI